MAEAELKIYHTTKNLKSAPQAFAFGFAEGFGKALSWAIVIGVGIWILSQAGAFDDTADEAASTLSE